MMPADRCLVLTGYDDAMAEVGDRVSRTHERYAAKWGFRFVRHRSYQGGEHPSWQKLRIVTSYLRDCDVLLWLDADTVVTNEGFDFRSLEPRAGILASADWNCSDGTRFSAGNYVAYAGDRTFDLLSAAQTLRQYAGRPNWDQDAMQDLSLRAWWEGVVTILPNRALNSVPVQAQPTAVAPWQPGDFLCHLTGIPNARRLDMLAAVCPL